MTLLRKPANICAYVMILSFFVLPWFYLGGASLTGHELSNTAHMGWVWWFPAIAAIAFLASFFRVTRVIVPVLCGLVPVFMLGYVLKEFGSAAFGFIGAGEYVTIIAGLCMIVFAILGGGDE